MKRSAILVFSFGLLLLAGCGDGDVEKIPVPTKINISPSTLSLNRGSIGSVTAQVLDQNNNVIPASVTFTTSNADVATVANNGVVCGGKWDSSFINCAAATNGTAEITATSGSISAKVTVYVHERVDAVTVSKAAGAACISQNSTQDFSARAFANGVDITSTVGPFSFVLSDTAVATVEQVSAAVGRLKSVQPGTTGVVAAVSGVNSIQELFQACAVRNINLHVTNSTDTSFALDATNTRQLAFEATDVLGAALTNLKLQYSSSNSASVAVTSTGLVTASVPGGSVVVASCTPPVCNANLHPVFSNPVKVTVNGTSQNTTVYVSSTVAPAAGAQATIIPIDTGTNAAGAAITSQNVPNSLLFSRNGARLFVGTNGAVANLDIATGASAAMQANGRVLAGSPDSSRLLTATADTVYFSPQSNAAPLTLPIAGATAGAFSPDGSRAWVVAGSTLHVINTGNGAVRAIAIGGAARDVAFLASGHAGYIGGPDARISVRATCDNSLLDTIATTAAPVFIQPVNDGVSIVAVDGQNIYEATAAVEPNETCPNVSTTMATTSGGIGAFTATSMVVSSHGDKAYITTNTNKILVYNLTNNSLSTFTLGGTATEAYSADLTLDGKHLFVGVSGNAVQRFDTATGTVSATISLSIKPDLLAVRPR